MPARRHTAAVLPGLALAAALASTPILAQTTNPEITASAVTVPQFSTERYMGQWYEIARLDHPFERGLTRVTSARRLLPDGTIEVTNRGFDARANQWREAKATARVVPSAERPTLTVTYGPGAEHTYEVLAMAEDNSHALVGSRERDALWVFSRTPTLDEGTVESLKARALSLGYKTDGMMRVEQQP